MLRYKETYRQMAQASRMNYRVPVIVALVTSLVFALTIPSKLNASVSSVPSVEQKAKLSDEVLSQEGLKAFLGADCPHRVRRDWLDLTSEERNLYFDAFWEMYKRGYVALFFQCHVSGAIHFTPNFLPWHRMFTFEFESRIRALGGRFRCFALPYWDWTRGASKTVGSNPLWKQGFGGEGVLSAADLAYFNATGKYRKHSSLKIPGGCVMDGRFGKPTGFRSTVGDCLRRVFRPHTYWYQSTEQTLYAIEQTQSYADFVNEFALWHAPVHDAIGDGTLASQEPLFFLIHSYVDLVWSMRSDCHGYDGMANWRTNTQIYAPALLNSKMGFPVIDKYPWSLSYHVQLTPALTLNWPQFEIQYDFSDMWVRTRMQLNKCRFSYYHPKAPKKLPQGSIPIPDRVLASRGCRLAFAGCWKKYRASLVGCGNLKPAKIAFKTVLERTGIKTNICVRRLAAAFKLMKKTEKSFMTICHGGYDPVCPSNSK